ncbi:cytochrome P450 [Streptomyces canarius]
MDASDTEGEPMSEAGLAATGQALLLAGHETTAGFVATMTAHLLSDRSRWERLLEDRSLIRSAVEEVLRFDPNGSGFGMLRYAHEDVELADSTIPRGATVVCSMAAANRDERAWADADSMDLGRSPNPHLAFGAGPQLGAGSAPAHRTPSRPQRAAAPPSRPGAGHRCHETAAPGGHADHTTAGDAGDMVNDTAHRTVPRAGRGAGTREAIIGGGRAAVRRARPVRRLQPADR